MAPEHYVPLPFNSKVRPEEKLCCQFFSASCVCLRDIYEKSFLRVLRSFSVFVSVFQPTIHFAKMDEFCRKWSFPTGKERCTNATPPIGWLLFLTISRPGTGRGRGSGSGGRRERLHWSASRRRRLRHTKAARRPAPRGGQQRTGRWKGMCGRGAGLGGSGAAGNRLKTVQCRENIGRPGKRLPADPPPLGRVPRLAKT